MNPGPSRLRRAVPLVLVGALYLLSQLPALPSTEAGAIAARFRFEKLPFPEPAGFPHNTVRQVHPSVAHLSGYAVFAEKTASTYLMFYLASLPWLLAYGWMGADAYRAIVRQATSP